MVALNLAQPSLYDNAVLAKALGHLLMSTAYTAGCTVHTSGKCSTSMVVTFLIKYLQWHPQALSQHNDIMKVGFGWGNEYQQYPYHKTARVQFIPNYAAQLSVLSTTRPQLYNVISSMCSFSTFSLVTAVLPATLVEHITQSFPHGEICHQMSLNVVSAKSITL